MTRETLPVWVRNGSGLADRLVPLGDAPGDLAGVPVLPRLLRRSPPCRDDDRGPASPSSRRRGSRPERPEGGVSRPLRGDVRPRHGNPARRARRDLGPEGRVIVWAVWFSGSAFAPQSLDGDIGEFRSIAAARAAFLERAWIPAPPGPA